MKRVKMIGGVLLSCLMLCALLIGCSDNNSQFPQYEKGVVTENEFVSEWMGLKYTLPAGMDMVPAESLNANSTAQVQMEMQVLKNDNTGNNLVILTEDLSSKTSVDEKQYIKLAKPQLETLSKEVTFDEVGKRTVAGQEFFELPYHFTMTYSGVTADINQTLLCKKQGNRMICITLSYADENAKDDLLAGFSQI